MPGGEKGYCQCLKRPEHQKYIPVIQDEIATVGRKGEETTKLEVPKYEPIDQPVGNIIIFSKGDKPENNGTDFVAQRRKL